MMDEDFLHLFEESPALRLLGRLGSFVVGFFLRLLRSGDHRRLPRKN